MPPVAWAGRGFLASLDADIPVGSRSPHADAFDADRRMEARQERRMCEFCACRNADSRFGILNAAAVIHGIGDYMAAVATVALQRVHRSAGGLGEGEPSVGA